MRTIKTNVYKFNELNDTAKEKARNWYREGNTGEFEWENIQEDAKTIGLEIIQLDTHRPNKGRFLASAEETAHKIEKEHGETCETHKTAKAYLKERDGVIESAERDENGEFTLKIDDKLNECDAEFLRSLLEDYRIMLERNIEYQNSDEAVDENIEANEYEFNEEGKIK